MTLSIATGGFVVRLSRRAPHNLCWVSDLPESVRVREVGPRDGFQNEPDVIPTADKVRLIDMLGAAGLRRIELTSFVRPDVIPQLADAEDVLRTTSVVTGSITRS